MVIQGELQPFDKKSMHEMHLHTLPWPKEVLEELGETPVTLKLTLSYFIEPGPGEVGWKDKISLSLLRTSFRCHQLQRNQRGLPKTHQFQDAWRQ